jgi:predicted CXXCH cytochrome family protein
MYIINKKRSLIPLVAIFIIFFGFLINSAKTTVLDEDPVSEKGIENSVFAEENEQCLKCHAEEYYTLTDTLQGKEKRRNMCADYQVERDQFYNSVHWSFSCLDCHDEAYNEFPHAMELRFAEYWTCMDCHGYDDNFASFRFEEIDEAHMNSIHSTATEGDFSCWNCHDPHSYQLLSRANKSMADIILESNNMCLECHGDIEKFRLLSDRELGNIVPEHDWLPNQGLHFKAVRCIECHSEISDSLLVSHTILPSDNAVKKCVDCHSTNSILMGTLYKFRAQEQRKESGFVNGVIIENNAYVIGANRSRFLNIGSLIIFGLILGAVSIHVILRIVLKKK